MCSAKNPLGVGRGLDVPLGQMKPGGHGPDPFAEILAASQKNPDGHIMLYNAT
jgi:hypothetical protein